MRDLVPIENEKGNAFSHILRFYQKADISLTPEEDVILARWIYCDALLRSNKFRTDDIIEKLREKYGISPFTAQSDIKNTYALFGATRVLSKNYLLNQQIEEITRDIERYRYDKSLATVLPKLYAEKNKAIALLQEQQVNETEPAPIINLQVVEGQQHAVGALTFEQGKELLRLKRQQQSKAIEDIDHEEL